MEDKLEIQDKSEWKREYLHFFILSTAGKPIYSRHGDENELAALMGVMQAINFFAKDISLEIEEFMSNNKRVVFHETSSLIFVTVGSIAESKTFFKLCINYVNKHIIFLLSKSKLDLTFEKSSSLDLRHLLVDNVRRFDKLLLSIELSLGPYIGRYQCIPLKKTFRDNLNTSLVNIIKQDSLESLNLVFLVLFYKNELVTFISMKNYSLTVLEIHLISNLLETSKTFKAATSNWLPICLPDYDPKGFLHAHISYIQDDLVLTLISYDRNKFYELDILKTRISTKFCSQSTIFSTISSARRPKANEVEGLNDYVRLFIYIYDENCYTSSSWTCPYGEENGQEVLESDLIERRRVMAVCRNLYDKLMLSHVKCDQIYMMVSTEAFYATKNGNEISIMIFEPFIDQIKAGQFSSKLQSWIQENKNRIFLTNQIHF